ncbi:hypothetical protein SORBI_3001G061101 [Sorghum bicolor]|uniref:Uncharacterized protein n=1 Tax=Sorghum bicolor TaxID=4558 RepID=A0A1Z5S4H7_SORBI|nr:hypothetical protein SORBI_3001G061101 [Sorghum bicolor]
MELPQSRGQEREEEARTVTIAITIHDKRRETGPCGVRPPNPTTPNPEAPTAQAYRRRGQGRAGPDRPEAGSWRGRSACAGRCARGGGRRTRVGRGGRRRRSCGGGRRRPTRSWRRRGRAWRRRWRSWSGRGRAPPSCSGAWSRPTANAGDSSRRPKAGSTRSARASATTRTRTGIGSTSRSSSSPPRAALRPRPRRETGTRKLALDDRWCQLLLLASSPLPVLISLPSWLHVL